MESTTVLREISIDDILEPSDQVRTVIVLEGLEDLAQSIKTQGIIQPLIVLKKNEKYEIIAGHRRYLSSKMAGLSVLPCIIRGADMKEVDFLKLHENSFREDVNPVDEGRYFIRLHEKYSLTYNEIAKLGSRSLSYVMNRIQILQGDGRVLAALEACQINFSQGLEILKAESENVREELLRVVIESGATVEALRMIRYDFEKNIRSQGIDHNEGSSAGEGYVSLKHLIECPVCAGKYPVQNIYPISVCKTCYDGFMAGLKSTE